MTTPYFQAFEHIVPPPRSRFVGRRVDLWHLAAGLTIGLGGWYLYWRWTQSLNPDALIFSSVIAAAETCMFLGTLLFFFDIWREEDTVIPQPLTSAPDTEIKVDIFITTYDEDVDVVRPSLDDARAVVAPSGVRVQIYLLDDGARAEMRDLARAAGALYFSRPSNLGYKAGNLKNALLRTDGDFVVICDADTRLFPGFLTNTLGYFDDKSVAWVQTPHWFYDIPAAQPWAEVLPKALTWAGPLLGRITGTPGPGEDPFLNGSTMFFDVIQRRRNRHGASFCCGAASIHRRDTVFEDALFHHSHARVQKLPNAHRKLGAAAAPSQPFRFHVSEDILTSMSMHASPDRRSVYHPQVEARMLSPWSLEAWAAQKLKYAGGTIDIFLRHNPLLSRTMPWRVKLHYAATFWSYLSAPIVLILILAPVVTLFSGVAPVDAYSIEFFAHLLPFLLMNEVALILACNGSDGTQGRMLSIATLPITLRALVLSLLGREVRFKPTPKKPGKTRDLRLVRPQMALLGIMATAACYGLVAHSHGSTDHTPALLIVNLAWMVWNGVALAMPVLAAFWRPFNKSQPAEKGADT